MVEASGQIMKLWTLFRYEWKTYLADKQALGVILLAPLFLLLLCGYALSPLLEEESVLEPIDLALVNLDPSWETRTIIHHFESSKELRKWITLHQVTMKEAQKLLMADRVAALIIIPEHFSKDLEVGINTPVQVMGNPRRPLQAELVRILMESGADFITAAQSGVNTIYLYMRTAKVSAAELEQLFNQSVLQFTLQSLNRGELFASQSITPFFGLTAREYYVVSLSILFLLVSGLLAVRSNLGERKLLEKRLLAIGVPMTGRILAGWLTLISLLVIPYTLYYGLVFPFLPERNLERFSLFLLSSLLVLGSISAFHLFLTALIREPANLNLFGFLLIGVMSLLGGTLIPLAYFPQWVAQLHLFSLNKWIAQGLLASLFGQTNHLLTQSMLILGLVTIALLVISVWLTKRRLG